MPITISSTRRDEIIAAIDYAHNKDAIAKARAHQQFKWLNLTVSQMKSSSRDQHLIDILAYILTQPDHSTPQMAIYLAVYMNYHHTVKHIEFSGRFIEDLQDLISMRMITQDNEQQVKLTTIDHRPARRLSATIYSYSDAHIQSLLQCQTPTTDELFAATPSPPYATESHQTSESKRDYEALLQKYNALQTQNLKLQSNLLATYGARSASIASTASQNSADDSLSPEWLTLTPPSPPRPF